MLPGEGVLCSSRRIKVNTKKHTCPSIELSEKVRADSNKWIAAAILKWLREDASLAPATLREKLKDKYRVKTPYMRVFYGKEMALDMIQGKWNDSFPRLYSFKAELEKISPRSVVDIDYENVKGKVKKMKGKKYKLRDKKCFRRCFVSLKACSKGFLEGCSPYLAVDSTALTGKFRGQLAATYAIDGHNWLFPVAYGILEGESNESWAWFMERLCAVIGHPPCHHALDLYFILSLRGEGSEIWHFVDEYYSVAKFYATYAKNVPPMTGKHQWEIVDPGFKLDLPILRRPPGRPRKQRIKGSHEKGARLGARKNKCKRCGGLGHIKCRNPVFHDLEDVPVLIEEVNANEASVSAAATSTSSKKGRKNKEKKVTKKRKRSAGESLHADNSLQ